MEQRWKVPFGLIAAEAAQIGCISSNENDAIVGHERLVDLVDNEESRIGRVAEKCKGGTHLGFTTLLMELAERCTKPW